MNIKIEDVILKIIELQNEEVQYRIDQFNLGKKGEIDNLKNIKELVKLNNLIAELNSDYNLNLYRAFRVLVKSGFLSKGDLERLLQSDKPLSELFCLVYGRPYEGNIAQVFYNWESMGLREPDPLDKSIRNLYLCLERAAFRFKFDYVTKDSQRVEGVYLSTYPLIDLSIHQFPEKGTFGHMRCDGAGLHRRSFVLYPNEEISIDNFDARFLEIGGYYALHSLHIGNGFFGREAKYVDRCVNLLYKMLTERELPKERNHLILVPHK